MNRISRESKKEFLLWYLREQIQDDAKKISDLSKDILNSPADTWIELYDYKEDVFGKHLSHLHAVNEDKLDNVENLFKLYEHHYPTFLKWKRKQE